MIEDEARKITALRRENQMLKELLKKGGAAVDAYNARMKLRG